MYIVCQIVQWAERWDWADECVVFSTASRNISEFKWKYGRYNFPGFLLIFLEISRNIKFPENLHLYCISERVLYVVDVQMWCWRIRLVAMASTIMDTPTRWYRCPRKIFWMYCTALFLTELNHIQWNHRQFCLTSQHLTWVCFDLGCYKPVCPSSWLMALV